jgi:hypothetical protein
MGKYGTNLEGFGAFEGGVNADKGAPLVSTSSDGETALLFGPAALREIQAGVANGDFAIPPDAAGDTITAENPLPYWTFTDVNSAGAITAAIVADADAGSGNILRWSVAANTTTDKSAVLSKFIPVTASRDQAYSYMPELSLGSATSTSLRSVVLTMQFFKQDQTTTTGTALSETRTFSTLTLTPITLFPTTNQVRFNTPSDAAFLKISIEVSTTGTFASVASVDMYEVRANVGQPILQLADRVSPATEQPASIWKQSGFLLFKRNSLASLNAGEYDLRINTVGNVDIFNNLGVGGDAEFLGQVSNWVSRITNTAGQSLTNNTDTKLIFNNASSTPASASYDPQGWFNDANDSIDIGQDGFYCITANVSFATNATGRRQITLVLNGTGISSVVLSASSSSSTNLVSTTNMYLFAGDQVTVNGFQNSGGALNTLVQASGAFTALSVGRIGA